MLEKARAGDFQTKRLCCYICNTIPKPFVKFFHLQECCAKNSRESVLDRLIERAGDKYAIEVGKYDLICEVCASQVNTLDKNENERTLLQKLENKFPLRSKRVLQVQAKKDVGLPNYGQPSHQMNPSRQIINHDVHEEPTTVNRRENVQPTICRNREFVRDVEFVPYSSIRTEIAHGCKSKQLEILEIPRLDKGSTSKVQEEQQSNNTDVITLDSDSVNEVINLDSDSVIEEITIESDSMIEEITLESDSEIETFPPELGCIQNQLHPEPEPLCITID